MTDEEDPWTSTRRRLDETAARGCQHPGCSHESDDEILWLHQRCHTGAPRFLDRLGGAQGFGGVLTLRCAVCMRPIISFKAKTESFMGGGWKAHGAADVFTQECCESSSGVSGSYVKGSGRIIVSCYYCEKKVAELTI